MLVWCRGVVAMGAARRARELRLSVRRRRGSELDRGASRCPRGATRGASAPCLRGYAHVSSSRQRPARHAFGSCSLASEVGCSRALSSGSWCSIPGWRSDGGRASSGSADVMPHNMRERCDSSRVRAHMWLP
jgi:hypothetical protein